MDVNENILPCHQGKLVLLVVSLVSTEVETDVPARGLVSCQLPSLCCCLSPNLCHKISWQRMSLCLP